MKKITPALMALLVSGKLAPGPDGKLRPKKKDRPKRRDHLEAKRRRKEQKAARKRNRG